MITCQVPFTYRGGFRHPASMTAKAAYVIRPPATSELLATKVSLNTEHLSTEKPDTSKRSNWKQNQYEHIFFLPLVG
jgi:hypothetical protein